MLGGWAEFAAAFALFMASHVLPARPAVRGRLVGVMGEGAYLAGFIALSLGLLGWLISASGRAPYVELWPFASWQVWLPNLAMPVACLLAAFAIVAPNPFSFGGAGNDRFDPAASGIAGAARHPLLWAVALWAASHVVPNGDLAHVLLFGSFAIFALVGMIALDRRRRAQIGAAEWDRLAHRTSLWPFAALLNGRWRPSLRRLSLLRLTLGVLVWAVLIVLHGPVIGVSPIPH